MTEPSLPRYNQSRRAFLQKAVASAGAAMAFPAVLAACGDSDEAIFGADSNDETTTTSQQTTTQESTTTSSTTQPETSTTTVADTAARAFGPVAINFTYTMGVGGKPLNPYVAVWIEDTAGTLIRTVELWFEQSQKGPRWLDDLRDWWRVDQARIGNGGQDEVLVVSSATRTPGSYSLLWDGLDENGEIVSANEVVVCVESARERGPHSVSCAPIVSGSGVVLPEDGELSGVTVEPV